MDSFPENYECEGQIDIWEWMKEKEQEDDKQQSREVSYRLPRFAGEGSKYDVSGHSMVSAE